MPSTLVARKTVRTLPITSVDEAAYKRWLKRQSKATKEWVKANEFEPKGSRALLVPGPRGPREVIFGASAPNVWSYATLAQRVPPGRYRFEPELDAAQATAAAIGWELAAYSFDRLKSAPAAGPRELVWPANADRAEATRVFEAIAAVRDRINLPASEYGPFELAVDAARVADRYGAEFREVTGAPLESDYPAIAAVGRGSARAPRLLDLRWGDPAHPKVTLVGKGVVFDAGGLNLKSSSGMLLMKKDMGGAAIVLGLAAMVMDAELPVRLRVLVPVAENMPSHQSYRPGDVLRMRNGKTVEVTNTDAEGRLILADALADADVEQPALLIDVATLTGAARYAVGPEITPFFTADGTVADELASAARRASESVWRLPLHGAYRRHLDSRVADLRNSTATPFAGAITAALFLREFVSKAERWIHLDVYGWCEHARPGRPIGGEATGMLPLWELLKARYPRATA
ncbi:MAG: M17 family metallopeptidase [Sandaracinaceae bacterium]